MPLLNSKGGYGALTKLMHWLIAALFAFQYVAAHIMIQLGPNDTTLGVSQAAYYNWHKSLGLVALAFAVIRLLNRRAGELPPWAPTLTETEQRFIHRIEQILYFGMFLMPVSGFIYVMAGDYGVRLFGLTDLPNPIGASPILATFAKWTHVVASWVVLTAVASHLALVLRHQFILRDGLLRRMLPGRW